MKYVIGVDLGTSAVKLLLVNQKGKVVQEVSKEYPLMQEKAGYSEQNPEDWVEQTIAGLSELAESFSGDLSDIEGISFSGQMHGLVLLDEQKDVIRPAILWNDTRTTAECQEITERVGKDTLLQIPKNIALEGFTLPKILWVRKHEPENYAKAKLFLLPKDYLRFRLTGQLHMDYSDAAGTLLLDIEKRSWSKEICEALDIDPDLCPSLISSHEAVGNINEEIVKKTGLPEEISVFAGGADNACGAVGAGILEEGKTMASIGTSGVVLSYEGAGDKSFEGKVHYFNHAAPDAYYTMGVTLAAGHSLSWFKDTFAEKIEFDDLLNKANNVAIGANGLLFTPYIVGERTPHVDASIRGSFIGVDSSHETKHFTRAVIEGITFSLNESVEIFRENGKVIDNVIAIGGGAKSDMWLQIQADVFNATVIKPNSEQGPGMGAAMLAAYGSGWFESLQECASVFLEDAKTVEPIPENVEKYKELFTLYQSVYASTNQINKKLMNYRNNDEK
ncbi:xylulokinase [Oceanobacillus jeddahense]|uniref:Xylulose kinase n=1 Tax=Oceanobacillus jeddahense TaxID=1462527 RepID=A0ABY5JU79_9BACI|nr:xylulokinase [Oceanobacillus jeddahense]UUI03902.1 xylulokinase [Oceanobacillus jeddahense]